MNLPFEVFMSPNPVHTISSNIMKYPSIIISILMKKKPFKIKVLKTIWVYFFAKEVG